MRLNGFFASASGLALLLTLGACAGGEDRGASMFVQTCSLGCSNGEGGLQVNCSVISTYENQEIAVYFSEPVDPGSVDTASFSLIDVNTGGTPVGERFIDATNPRKLVFRPSVSFDSTGVATFGFQSDHTYRVTVPGEAQGDNGPFIRSADGVANRSRLQCDIRTVLGVVDPVPGSPTVEVVVDLAITSTMDPNDYIEGVPAQGALDVWRSSTIRFDFLDLMNPVTLVNPVTLQLSFITVAVDTDPLSTLDAPQPLSGTAIVDFDPIALRTRVTFIPSAGIPSSGNPDLHEPRQILVTIPADVRDLVGNSVVATPIAINFTPEYVELPPVVLPDADGENFTNLANADLRLTSALWGVTVPGISNYVLNRGWGGGGGRLGELNVKGGITINLSTDSQSFPLTEQVGYDLLTNLVPGVDYFPPADPPALIVSNGAFEFSRLVVQSGGRLVITGIQPARVFSRGSMIINGQLDASGASSPTHDSESLAGGIGAAGGPGGGDGGEGASRGDTTIAELILIGGVNIDETTVSVHTSGDEGMGVGRDVLTNMAAGGGGAQWPTTWPIGTDAAELMDLTLSSSGAVECENRQIASGGAGGAYATNGTAPTVVTFPASSETGIVNLPSVLAAPGDATEVGLEPPDPQSDHLIRLLSFEGGWLRGGSGGGGGGAHLGGSTTGGFAGFCSDGATLSTYWDNSAAGAGGGGGAIQVVSGNQLLIAGLIRARGGDGASSFFGPTAARKSRSTPGGGGAGGAVRLQATDIVLSTDSPPRIDISGGTGGSNAFFALPGPPATARGGNGGAGLVRAEERSGTSGSPALMRTDVAPSVAPILPFDSRDILSTGYWAQPRARPESFTGATSCWMRPTGAFFSIEFAEDGVGTTPASKAWNMDIVYQAPATAPVLIKYRGTDPASPFPTGDMESNLGNLVNYDLPVGNPGSYFAVRFQGAAAVGTLSDPCAVDFETEVISNSLTPWVQHPAQLNDFVPQPNMIRFCVVFDTSLVMPSSVPLFIKGITNLTIRAQPD